MAKRKAAADKNAETALAVQKKGELALAGGYGDYANEGFENVTSDDLSIPFLTVMQSNSPEIKPESKGGLGLEIGQLFNTVTQEAFDGETGIGLVPAITQHEWVEWAPREGDGGFIARYDCDDPLILEAKATQQFGQYKNGDNNLVETYYIYGVLYDVEELHSLGAAVISFSKTKIKRYKRLMSALRAFQLNIPTENGQPQRVTPPLFAHSLVVCSCDDKNNKGEFQNFNIVPSNGDLRSSLIDSEDPRFQEALMLKRSIEKGEAKAAYSSAASSEGLPTDENGEPAF
jgi:hypothetical protein